MLPEDKDAAYLWDIRQAAQEILEFAGEMDCKEFEQNKMARYAVERQLLVIGEAAKNISSEFKQKNSQIPWLAIIGQRNIIAHEYGEILVERIWRVVREHIPELIKQIDPLIPDLPE